MNRGRALGVELMRELLRAKLTGQAGIMALLGGDHDPERIEAHASSATMLKIEAMSALAYWGVLKDLPLQFTRAAQVSDHWKRVGLRQSPLTGRPQRAISPGQALFNFCYSLAAAELTIALTAVGLDPSFAVFHNDRENRDSLSWDAIEAIRPLCDGWLLTFIGSTVFAKRDFYERPDGTIRITMPLRAHLGFTAGLWRKPADVLAGWLLACFSTGQVRPMPVLSTGDRRIIPRCCAECGRALPSNRHERFCSKECLFAFNRAEKDNAAAPLIAYRRAGGVDMSRSTAAQAKRRAGNKLAAGSRYSWARERFGVAIPSPVQLAPLRAWYAEHVAPKLAGLAPSTIRAATGLSNTYVELIRDGTIPHPQYFKALAAVVGIEPPAELGL
jgi:hypothetical protein